jgi:ATP-dependent DNA helicase RecQ
LELEGVLRQGTPFYAGYEFKALNQRTPTEVAQHFPEPFAAEILRVFGAARRGRIWHALDPEVAATTLGVERRRVVRILDVLQEQGLIELRVSDARQRFYRCRDHEDAAALTELLVRRFQAREDAELARLERVLKLVGARECQVNALTAYFGERRATPCGHCSVCRTGESVALAHPASAASAPLPRRELMALRTEYPAALGTDRQLARFLCGLSSPASSKARLGRHIRFGCRESVRFAQVLRNLQENKDA